MLESSNSLAISPNARRPANEGRGTSVGRRRTRPNVFVNARLVAAFGDTTLTGLRIVSLESTCWIAPTTSSILIQLMNCDPLPITPFKRSLNGRSIFFRAPHNAIPENNKDDNVVGHLIIQDNAKNPDDFPVAWPDLITLTIDKAGTGSGTVRKEAEQFDLLLLDYGNCVNAYSDYRG